MSKTAPNYITDPIAKTMIRTAVAMLPGTLAISGYNLADTYFVSDLGTMPLAAMGFAFPVIMIINCIFHGMGAGIMTPVAQALGGERTGRAGKIISIGAIISTAGALLVGGIGILFSEQTFSLFGASEEVMPLINNYMMIWYLFAWTGVLSMITNNLLISAGEPGWASFLMCTGLSLNILLDPILIYGYFGMPALNIQGAAIATVICQFLSAMAGFAVLHYRRNLISNNFGDRRLIMQVFFLMLKFGIPSIFGMLLMPIGGAVITWITAHFGEVAVAAVTASARLESVAFVFPMALGITLLPMVGQNFGAKEYGRINQCRRWANRFALYFELSMAIIFFLFAPFFSSLFSREPEVQQIMISYLRIVPWGFAMIEIHRYSTFFFTGTGNPSASAWLNALRIVGLLLPLSMLALYFNKLEIIFIARLVADMAAGIVGWSLASRLTNRLLKSTNI